MNHKEYVHEKTRYSYKLVKENRLFEKVRAIILNSKNNVLLIKDLSSGKTTVPGGGVDEGETLEDAVIREAKEEADIDVTPIKIIDKNFYEVPMSLGDECFVSKRVEYMFLCKLNEGSPSAKVCGIAGEYAGKMEVGFFELSELSKGKFSQDFIQKIKDIT